MKPGRLIAVVGPSGVGKDSLIDGISRQLPTLSVVRRFVTRAPGLGGENYMSVTEPEYHRLVHEGAFCLHWSAHGLYYGVPTKVLENVRTGDHSVVNLSRSVLTAAAEVFPTLKVLYLTAKPETRAKRLKMRGRESDSGISRRLAASEKPLPDELDIATINNDGLLSEAVNAAVVALTLEDVA